MIGVKIAHLFNKFDHQSSLDNMIRIIQNIEKEFTNIQQFQLGRNMKLSKDRNFMYLFIPNIIHKLKSSDIEDTIKTPRPILSSSVPHNSRKYPYGPQRHQNWRY